MAITHDGRNVIAVRQFREAANEVILEVPGDNPKKGQTAEDVVRAELLEETGYQAGKIIDLAPNGPIWIEPSSFSTPMLPFLVVGCVKVDEQTLDETENMEVEIIPLTEWLNMCFDGRIRDNKTLAITFLSLPHLGIQLTDTLRPIT
jgi:8-oxo-dGTP pyrophosphatase MutT (NUDIX family)